MAGIVVGVLAGAITGVGVALVAFSTGFLVTQVTTLAVAAGVGGVAVGGLTVWRSLTSD